MEPLRKLADDLAPIVWHDRYWLVWNTFLAVLPAVIAVPLFRRHRRWGPLSWFGALLFVLFLPNAPYVVTDLVHLRTSVGLASHDVTVYAGVLPVYATFIAAGFASYTLCLAEVGGWLRRTGRVAHVRRVELALHAACAVGVLLGRVTRLNSWDTFTAPESTLSRPLDTLTLAGTPLVVAVLFTVIWLGHAVTRTLVGAAMAWIAARSPRWQPSP